MKVNDMSKCVLVMDMPTKCIECPVSGYDKKGLPCCRKEMKHLDTFMYKPSWCPLKPMPEKQKLTFIEAGQDAITMGWNAAIEQMEGG